MPRFIGILAVLILVVIASSALFHWGKATGSNEVRELWNQEKQRTVERISGLEQQYTELTKQHAVENEKLKHEINQSRIKHETELSAVRDEYADRLLSSEQRTNLYKRQAETGSIEHRSLANYAAELDRTLEEGRHLVQELRIALRQREREIVILSTQIHTDRNLLERADLIHGNN